MPSIGQGIHFGKKVIGMAGKLGKAFARNITKDPFTAQVQAESKKRKLYEQAVKKTFK